MKLSQLRFQALLAGCLLFSPLASQAQSPYLYEKGKSFVDMPARRVATIRLAELRAPLYREVEVPAGTNTICYSVVLPDYARGVFYSRDVRVGDFQWPNNTNRLLPWAFSHLEEITKGQYPGIPSNGAPSPVGDAMLLMLSDGEYLFAKALAGGNSHSWLQANADGSLSVYVSTLGADPLSHQVPVVLATKGKTACQAIAKAYDLLMANGEVAATRRREAKQYFEAFEYLGWCSWEHHHQDIDEAKLLADLDAIEQSGLPVRYVLIDDGHLSHSGRQLTSFAPDAGRFPHGWAAITSRKQAGGVRWMGLWHNMCGYWNGISPTNTLPHDMRGTLYPWRGTLLPGPHPGQIGEYYDHYVEALKGYGFDFLKIDNQAQMLPFYMGGEHAVGRAKACNVALEEAAHHHKMGLMNCMAQGVVNIDNTLHSSVARVSIDYKKYDETMAKSHLFQSYANTLLQGQTVWPDHDMFHSCDTVCGPLMARSKAISGGPVYLSDAPARFVGEHILPLVDAEGRIFRPQAPAIPTPESVFANPLRSGEAYRVFAPTGCEAVSLICYNLNTSPEHTEVQASVSPADYLLRESMTGRKPASKRRLLAYDWAQGTASELKAVQSVPLRGFSDRLFHLCPIVKGWAVIGIREKYLSPATVSIIHRYSNQLTLDVHCPGTLLVWVEKGSERQLRTIPITTPGPVVIDK